MTPREVRRANWFIRALAAAPVIWVALFYAYVLRARFSLGYWPRPYKPDPKDLDFMLHHLAIVLGVPAVFFACAAAALWAFMLHRRGHRPFPWLVIVAVCGLLAGLYYTIALDLGDYVTWFLD